MLLRLSKDEDGDEIQSLQYSIASLYLVGRELVSASKSVASSAHTSHSRGHRLVTEVLLNHQTTDEREQR